MTESEAGRVERERQIDALIAEYYEAQERGTAPEPEAFVAAHPEFAEELRDFLADLGRIGLATPSTQSESERGSPRLRGIDEALGTGTRIRFLREYELLEVLGSGGMGVVFKARQTTLQRIVALKLIKAGALADAQELRRFEAEARAAARLTHPGIVSVYEVGTYQGHRFYTMDYVEGGSLNRLYRDGPVPTRRAAELVQKLAQAMDYAHQQGIVHRDLKPANILLTTEGEPRIADFGIAKQLRKEDETELMERTQTGQILGTAGYMSPEQAAGQSRLVGPASDIYSLGAVLYALLTGRPPFVGESLSQTILQVLQREPLTPRLLNAAIPADLETICLKCLEKEPHRRYGTAQLLADDLGRFLTGHPVLARPLGRLRKTARWCRRNPWVTTSLVLLTVLVVASSLFARSSQRTARERQQALDQKQIALDREQAALRTTTQQLSQTSLERARATRQSGQPGQRLEALEAIRLGSTLRSQVVEDANRIREWRDQAIGALSLVDLQHASTWTDEITSLCDVVVTPQHDRLITGLPQAGIVRVYRLPSDGRAAPSESSTRDIPTQLTANNTFFRLAENGRWLGSCDYATTRVRLFDLDQSASVGEVDGIHGWRAVDFHPTEAQALVGLKSGALVRFDLGSGSTTTLTPAGATILAVRHSADGRRMAVIRQSGQIEIRNAETKEIEQTLAVPAGSRGLCWSPDGTTMAVEVGLNVQLFRLADNARPSLIATCYGHRETVIELFWHPRLPLLASTSHDGTTALWDPVTGRRLIVVRGILKGFRHDGAMMAIRAPSAVEFWRVVPSETLRWLDHRWSRCLAVHPRLPLLASGHWNGVSLFDLMSGQSLGELPIGSTAGLAFHPQTGALWSTTARGLERWPIREDSVGSSLQVQLGPPEQITAAPKSEGSLRWSASGERLLAAGSGSHSAALLDQTGSPLTVSLPATKGMARMDLSPDGRWAAGGNATAEHVSIFNLKTGTTHVDLPVIGGLPFVRFSPDGERFAANGIETTFLWNVRDWGHVQRISTAGSNGTAALAFSPDNQLLAVGGWGTGLQLFELKTMTLLANLTGSHAPILFRDLEFSPDGTRLICAADREGTCVWNIQALRQQLRALDLDWEPPSADAPLSAFARQPLQLRLNLGQEATSPAP